MVDFQTCIERCLNRGVAGSGRSDDNRDSLTKRLHTYLTETQPIIDYYKKLDLVKTVDGTKTADEVYTDVKKFIHEVHAAEGKGDYPV